MIGDDMLFILENIRYVLWQDIQQQSVRFFLFLLQEIEGFIALVNEIGKSSEYQYRYTDECEGKYETNKTFRKIIRLSQERLEQSLPYKL